MHVLSLEGRPQGPVEWETDRARFLGRGRGPDDPSALDGRPLSGTTGAALDPIVSLRQRVRLAPRRRRPAVVRHRHGVEPRNRRWRWPRSTATRALPRRTFALAVTHAQSALRHLGISGDEALLFERLASRVLYRRRSLRASADVLRRNALGQDGAVDATASPAICRSCWSASARDDPGADAAGPRGAGILAAEGSERRRRHPERAPGRATSTRCTSRSRRCSTTARGATWKDRPGGVYLLRADRMAEAERDAARRGRAARCCSGNRGTLANQLDRPVSRPHGRAAAAAIRREPRDSRRRPRTPTPPSRAAPDARQRPRRLQRRRPASTSSSSTATARRRCPGSNVIANPAFGTIVTASGSAFTWAENSRENRLTPFCERPGHRPHCRGDVHPRRRDRRESWSPTPGPAARDADERPLRRPTLGGLDHVLARRRRGIDHELEVFVDPTDPVKFSLLTLTNAGDAARDAERLRATTNGCSARPEAEQQCTSTPSSTPTPGACSRTESVQPGVRRARGVRVTRAKPRRRPAIARRSSAATARSRSPAALARRRSAERFGAGLDPCAALHVADRRSQPGEDAPARVPARSRAPTSMTSRR